MQPKNSKGVAPLYVIAIVGGTNMVVVQLQSPVLEDLLSSAVVFQRFLYN